MECKSIVKRFKKLIQIRRNLYNKNIGNSLHQGQLYLLEFIKANIACTQSKAAAKLMVSPASIALSTKRMEKSGLIEKRIDTKCLRCKRLYITDKGIELSNHCRELFDDMDALMFQGFTKKELKILGVLLDRLIENLIDYCSCDTFGANLIDTPLEK